MNSIPRSPIFEARALTTTLHRLHEFSLATKIKINYLWLYKESGGVEFNILISDKQNCCLRLFIGSRIESISECKENE